MPPRMPRPLLALLSLAVLLAATTALHDFSGPFATVVEDWAIVAVFALASISCGLRAATVRDERIAWAILAAGLAVFACGNVVLNVWVQDDPSPPFPSVADFMWAALQPSAVVAMALIGRARGLILRAPSVLDGLICGLALTGLCAAFVYEPIFDEVVDRGATYGLFVPLLDLSVVAAALVGAASRGWRPHPVTVFVGLGFLTMAFGDCVYVVQAATDGYVAGTWIDLPFIAATALVAVAPWTRPGPQMRVESWDVRALALPLVAGAAGVGLTAAAVTGGLNPLADVAIVLLMATVVVRMALAMRSYGELLDTTRREAATDALTGLANRRRLFEDLERSIEPSELALFDLDGFKGFNDRLGHAAGDDLLAELGARLQAAVEPEGRAYRMGGDEFCVLVPTERAAATLERAAAALHAEVDGSHISCSWGSVSLPDEAAPGPAALKVADRRMYAVKNGRPTSAGTQLREALVRVLDVREPELHEHVRDVGALAAAVARRLGLPEHEVTDIVHGAELHDIGKLAVSESILRKPGPLDEREWAVMRLHTVHGAQLLAGIPALATAASLVRSSHERWDGAGYPDLLRGRQIPIGARIIAVCDAYDAIVTDRPYRPAASQAEALAELRRCAGGQFDPVVVEAFLAVVEANGPARRELAA